MEVTHLVHQLLDQVNAEPASAATVEIRRRDCGRVEVAPLVHQREHEAVAVDR